MKVPYISNIFAKIVDASKDNTEKYSNENRLFPLGKRRKTTYRMGIYYLSFIIIAAIIFSSISAWAQNQPTSSVSNNLIPNPDSKNLSSSQSFQVKTTSEGYYLGYVPNPIDLSKIKGYAVSNNGMLGYTPAFDLRTSGKVSPVKDQGPYGTCWAFATYGSLESNLLLGETRDFSESNIVNRAGFQGLTPDTGGNIFLSAAYLTRWDGPINEIDDPYSNLLSGSTGTYTTQKHVQDIYLFPTRSGPTNNDWIKYALTNYGAVYSSMYWDISNNDSNNNCTYYDPYNDGSNHAITIIGWDDNYPANKFPHGGAPGNGAFLIKNSWGSTWGNNGYFWISYYDHSIGYYNVAVVTAEPVNNYQHIYSYDKLGINDYLGNYGLSSAYFANVFTASSNEKIQAVSFYTLYPGELYTIKIYKDPTSATNPATGMLVDTESGSLANPGYRTVDLATPVTVNAGQKFSVVIQVSYPGITDSSTFYGYVPYESVDSGSAFYSNIPVSTVGQGFYSGNGATWYDITGIDSKHKANIDLKAFTNDLPTLRFNASSYSVNENDSTVTLRVDKVGATEDTVTVNYATADGTAHNGINYQARSGTLTFQPTDGFQTFTVNIIDDNIFDVQKYFTVSLTSPANANLGAPASSQVFINDTDVMAGFTSNVTSGTSPLTVQFNDTSMGMITDWQWNFGDGTGNSTIKDPIHTFNAPGTYSVTLTVSNAGGSSTKRVVNDIVVHNATPVANFAANITVGNTPLAVQFTDTSTGNNITAWQWNFGDGMANSTERNPIHTFTKTGDGNALYNVTLIVTNDGGNSTIKKVNYINVSSPLQMFQFSLRQGWNIISVPFVPQQVGITDFFPPTAMDDIEVIWMYNTSESSPWSYYTPRTDIYEQGTLTTIDEKHGYYVYCNNDTSFQASGTTVNETLILTPGWNLIGNPAMISRSPWDVYSGFEVIWEYNSSNTSSPWSYYTPRTDIYEQGSLTSIKPGYGYLIYK